MMVADRLPVAHADEDRLPAALEESLGRGHEDEEIGLDDGAVDHDLHAAPGHAQRHELVVSVASMHDSRPPKVYGSFGPRMWIISLRVHMRWSALATLI